MKRINKHVCISTILCAFTVVIFIVFYNRLPEMIPVHFDSSGNANSFWPKNAVVFGGPLAYVIINIVICIRLAIENKKRVLTYYIMPIIAYVITGIVVFLGMK